MGAVDPTYPLYPIACIIAAFMLLLVLLTSFVRQSWNLGVALLCFWLFFENIALAVNTVVWSGNADIRLHAYCDFVSRLEIACYVVKPMATLIITRRLYLIASLQSVDLPSKTARRWNHVVEWTLGLVIPLLVAGPLYYVVQNSRFEVIEGFGCMNSLAPSVLNMLLIKVWTVLPPVASIIIYYPRVIRMFCRQRRDVNKFLRSNTSVSRTNYFRILVLASIDVALIFPVGIANILLYGFVYAEASPMPFYPGWQETHTDWAPKSKTYAQLQTAGITNMALQYFIHWVTPVLGFVIFGLFGCTAEARASYWCMLCTVAGWFGWKPRPWQRRSMHATLDSIEFEGRPHHLSQDLEIGSRSSFIVSALHEAKINVKHDSYMETDASTLQGSPCVTLKDFDDDKSLCALDYVHSS